MNNNHKLYSFLLLVFFISFGLNAQTVSTYFGFNSNSSAQNLVTDNSGNLYFIINDYTNQQRSINKLASNGTTTSIISVSSNDQIYFQNLATDNSGNLYYIIDDYVNQQRAINKIDSNGNITSLISVNVYDPIYFYDLITDNSGNLYYKIDDYSESNAQRSINMIDSNGNITSLISVSSNDQIYFQYIATDTLGNLYYIIDDYVNQQRAIKKIDSNGNITSLISVSSNDQIYFQNLATDTLGNLYYIIDDYVNQQRAINKIDSNGNITSLISVNVYDQIYFYNLVTDNSGNFYFMIQDYTNSQRSFKKIDSHGIETSLISVSTNDQIYFNDLISDDTGNVYFIGDYSGLYKIMIITNPNYVCATRNDPTSSGASICVGITTVLSASGIGEMRWYDAPTGGNLIATGNEITTAIINANTTYYVEGFFCNSSSSRTPVTVTVYETPIAVISGNSTGNDFVTLTASGIGDYLWSGGYSPTQAVNYFTRTGTYSLTVINAGGCFNTANVSVVVNKLGITKFGELISDTTLKVNKNGSVNTVNYVNKHGKSSSSIATDGELNYAVFTAPASHPSNSNDFDSYTNASNQTSSGTYSSSLLLDWSDYNMLTNASISIPNGGERFSVQVSGFFIPEESGTYTFTCEGDDAVDLFINGVNVANHYGGHGIEGLGSHTGTINLLEGTKYTFRARMQENGGGEGLRVFWRKPSQSSGWYINTSEISSE